MLIPAPDSHRLFISSHIANLKMKTSFGTIINDLLLMMKSQLHQA